MTSIQLYFYNCRSVVNKLNLFQSFISTSDFSVFVITESWCSPYIFDAEIIPPNFLIFRKDRPSRGGGVFIAVQKSIPSKLIPSPDSLEVVAVEIQLPNPIVLCAVYLPPSASASSVSSTLHFLSTIVNQYNAILLGDFNFPDINWSTISSSTLSGSLFCEFVFDHNLSQLVKDSTHIKGGILDLVLCNSPHLITDLIICSNEPFPRLLSDHKLVKLTLPCNSSTSFLFLLVTHPAVYFQQRELRCL